MPRPDEGLRNRGEFQTTGLLVHPVWALGHAQFCTACSSRLHALSPYPGQGSLDSVYVVPCNMLAWVRHVSSPPASLTSAGVGAGDLWCSRMQ